MNTNERPLDYSVCYMTRIIHGGARLPDNHRSEVILHNGEWYFGEFPGIEQLRDFAAAVGGFSWSLHHSERLERSRVGCSCNWEPCEPYTIEYYTLSHNFDTDAVCHLTEWGAFPGFWSLDEVPAGAVPFVGLSNGSLVTCYATNDGETIRLYRPNPNAPDVYKPLSTAEHIAYKRAHGDMGPVCFAPNISGDSPNCPPEEVERIVANCEQYTLDPTFEAYGNFADIRPEWVGEAAKKYAGCVNFWGNFYDFSGVFNIITNNAAVISRLTEAIRRNQATAEYAAAKAEIKAKKEVRHV